MWFCPGRSEGGLHHQASSLLYLFIFISFALYFSFYSFILVLLIFFSYFLSKFFLYLYNFSFRGWSPPSGLLSLWPLSFYHFLFCYISFIFYLVFFCVVLLGRSEGGLHHQASSLFYLSSSFH